MTTTVRLDVNGEVREVRADGATPLLDVLREQLGLVGAKRGCSYGVCGTCTVLIDGMAARACLAVAADCAGRTIETVEALAPGHDLLHPIQAALAEAGAVQCGFCIPGVVMAAKALLAANPTPDEDAVREALSGQMCRCSGYGALVEAIVGMGRPQDG